MYEVMMIAGLVMWWLTSRKHNMLSPASIFCLISLFTMVVFYVVAVRRIIPDRFGNYWQAKGDYLQTAPQVMLFYLGLIGLGFAAHCLSCSTHNRLVNEDGIYDNAANMARIYKRVMNPHVSLLFMVLMLYVSILHMSQVNWSRLMQYQGYLSVRDPREVGLNDPLTSFVHLILPAVGMLYVPMAAVNCRARRYGMAALCAFPFIYALFISIAFDSRFVVLYLLLIAAILWEAQGRRFRALSVMMLVLSCVVLSVIMQLRFAGTFGVVPFIKLILSGKYIYQGILFYLVFGNFPGGFIMAEVFAMEGLTYPMKYKLLSLSPLPSAIDGFGSVRHAELRVNTSAPFSNFAEVYHFGIAYTIIYLFFLFASLLILSRFWNKNQRGLAVLILAPVYYSFIKIHSYPLRHTIRWIIASIIMAMIADYYNSKYRGARRRGVTAGRHCNIEQGSL